MKVSSVNWSLTWSLDSKPHKPIQGFTFLPLESTWVLLMCFTSIRLSFNSRYCLSTRRIQDHWLDSRSHKPSWNISIRALYSRYCINNGGMRYASFLGVPGLSPDRPAWAVNRCLPILRTAAHGVLLQSNSSNGIDAHIVVGFMYPNPYEQ